MVNADPTIDSLELLKDASRWVVKKNVPIFIPHVRKGTNGQELYRITENDLRDIAAVCNSRAAEGVLGKLQIGHTLKDKPETEQPPLAGLFQNYQPSRFGPEGKPCLSADFYYLKSQFETSKKYPFRSAEYYPNTKEITAVALLQRDPELDMGMLLFERKGPCYFYSSKELPMDFASQVIPDEAFDEKEASKFMLYMKKCFPKFYEQYGPGGGGQNGGTLDGMTGYQRQTPAVTPAVAVVLPPSTPGATAVSPLAKENAELYQRNEQLSARLAKIEGDYKADQLAVQYERQLRELDPEGRTLDISAELADLRSMTEAQAASHLKRLERAAQYSRTPIGQPMLRIEDSVQHVRDSAPTTEYESQAALDFVTAMQDEGKEIGFAEALREVKKKTRKTA